MSSEERRIFDVDHFDSTVLHTTGTTVVPDILCPADGLLYHYQSSSSILPSRRPARKKWNWFFDNKCSYIIIMMSVVKKKTQSSSPVGLISKNCDDHRISDSLCGCFILATSQWLTHPKLGTGSNSFCPWFAISHRYKYQVQVLLTIPMTSRVPGSNMYEPSVRFACSPVQSPRRHRKSQGHNFPELGYCKTCCANRGRLFFLTASSWYPLSEP